MVKDRKKRGYFMLPWRVRWPISDVIAVYALRLLIGLVLIRVVLPAFGPVGPVTAELADRVLVVALVAVFVAWRRGDWRDLGFSWRRLGRQVLGGLTAGLVLYVVSFASERVYTALFFAAPLQHPLVVMARQAVSLSALAVPLFLAGVAAPVAEEVLYRAFTLPPLVQRFGLTGGILLSAALFALLHFNAAWLVEVSLVGVGLALLYYRTGSLLSVITAHAFLNSVKLLFVYFGIPLV